MELGIVLLFWGLAGIILATLAAAALATMVYLVDRRRGAVRRRWLLTAIAFPYLALGYAAAAFIVYAMHCEMARGVDPGIGDLRRVSLGNRYALVRSDLAEETFIESPTGAQLHVNLRRIGTAGEVIVGEDRSGFFVIDTRTKTEHPVASESELIGSRSGTLGDPQLVSTDEYYDQHRWGWPDAIAAIGAIVPPIFVLSVLAWRFMGQSAVGKPVSSSAAHRSE